MRESVHHTEVIIIGAGLTGLTLGYYLKKKGIDFLIVEKEDKPGGVIRTFSENGFTFEAGPNTGVLANLEVMKLFEDLGDACTLEVADPKAKRRMIWKDGRWHCLPASLRQAVSTPLFTFRDKLRILGEPFRPRGKDPMESVAGLVKRRMGQSFLEYAVDPFIAGIYAGDPDRLITRFALPKLYNLEQSYGSFIKGAVKKKMKDQGPSPSREVFSVKGGLENLTHALIRQIGPDKILCGALQTRVGVAPGGFRLNTHVNKMPVQVNAPVVIPTIGAFSLGNIFPFFPPRQLEAITNLEYAKVVQVVLGFKEWKGSDIRAFGGLVPGREQRRILGVLFTSSFLSGRAPKGGVLLNVFLGGTRNPEYYDLDDQQLKQLVRSEITEMMKLPEYDPSLVKVFRYRHAIPQYGADSEERLQAIGELQSEFPGLILAGNLHEGIGMADRVAQAMRIAAACQNMLPAAKHV